MYDIIVLDLSIFKCKGFRDEKALVGAYIDGGELHNINVSKFQWVVPMKKIISLFTEYSHAQIIVAFDSYHKYIKTEMFPGYKGTRPKKKELNSKQEYTEMFMRLLDACSIPYVYGAGFEADDFMNAVRVQNPEKNILIVSNDSDILINVTDNCSVLRDLRADNSVLVTKEDFEKQPINGELYKYNTILAQKIAYGDKADNIPELPEHVMKKFFKKLNDIRNTTKFGHEYWSDAEFIEEVIRLIEVDRSVSEYEEGLLKMNYNLVAPLKMDYKEYLSTPSQPIQIDELKGFYNLFNPRAFPAIRAKLLDNEVFKI